MHSFRVVSLVTGITLALGCAGGASPTAPGIAAVEGTWSGGAFDSAATFNGVMQLAQIGSRVTGTLTTVAARTAGFSGVASPAGVSGTFVFTDSCGGMVSIAADLKGSPTRLQGTYEQHDCIGVVSGGFVFDRD